MPKIGSAPSGEDSSIDGTEKIPLTGSKWAYISTVATYIAAYVATLTQTLTNKTITAPTITSPTITGSMNIAVYEGDVVTSGGDVVLT